MDPKKKMRVLIAAGGSGGHLFPAQQLRLALQSDCEIFFAGHKLEGSPFFDREKIAYREIASAPLKKGFIQAAWKGFWQSLSLIRSFRPDVVVGFGSYHTFPLLLASVITRKKMVLFEANSELGKVNRFFSPFVKEIAFQFDAFQKKGVLVPLLPWVLSSPRKVSSIEGRAYFGLHPEKNTLLVFGGSQGSSFFNRAMPSAVDQLGENYQVIHLTGKGGSDVRYKTRAVVKEFEEKMDMAYAAADIVICRSGAGTISELIQNQKPALLIPFPHAAEDHQRKNGEFLIEKTGGARLLLEREATQECLLSEIQILLKEASRYRSGLKRYGMEQNQRMSFASLVQNIGRESK